MNGAPHTHRLVIPGCDLPRGSPRRVEDVLAGKIKLKAPETPLLWRTYYDSTLDLHLRHDQVITAGGGASAQT